MNKTIYVVVLEMEESEDYQLVENLQHRAFSVEADAKNWCEKLIKDFGPGYMVVPLELE